MLLALPAVYYFTLFIRHLIQFWGCNCDEQISTITVSPTAIQDVGINSIPST